MVSLVFISSHSCSGLPRLIETYSRCNKYRLTNDIQNHLKNQLSPSLLAPGDVLINMITLNLTFPISLVTAQRLSFSPQKKCQKCHLERDTLVALQYISSTASHSLHSNVTSHPVRHTWVLLVIR